MRENLDVFDFALSDEDLRAIAALDTGKSTILDDQDLETAKWVGTVTYDL